MQRFLTDQTNKRNNVITQSQQGIASVLVLLLVAAVVTVIGYAGYHIYQTNANKTVASSNDSVQTTAHFQPIKYSGQSASNGVPTPASSKPSGSTSGTSSASSSSSTSSAASSSSGAVTGSTTQPPAVSPPQPVPSPNPQPTNNGGSGISGFIWRVIGCTPPKMCLQTAPQPYQASVTVDTTSGTPVTSFTSDAYGKFKVMLDPGTYVLVPDSYDSGHITAKNQTVTVTAGKFTAITIIYNGMF